MAIIGIHLAYGNSLVKDLSWLKKQYEAIKRVPNETRPQQEMQIGLLLNFPVSEDPNIHNKALYEANMAAAQYGSIGISVLLNTWD